MSKLIKILNMSKMFDFVYINKFNCLYICGFYGYYKIIMNKKLFIKKSKDVKISFLFTNRLEYFNIYKNLLMWYERFLKLFFFKIKLRGLGFQLIKISKYLYKMFLGLNHFFYMHAPINMIIKKKEKVLLVISNDLVKLNSFFVNLLFLKKIDMYIKKGRFLAYNKIVILKKKINV